jgi:hypothetical protein
MSHFSVVKTCIKSIPALQKALIQIGISESAIEVDLKKGLTLNGWGSQRRKAHLKVKAGSSVNRYDMGWEIQEDGEAVFIHESMDSKISNRTWQNNLLQLCSVEQVKEKVEEEGWELEEEENLADGSIRLLALIH